MISGIEFTQWNETGQRKRGEEAVTNPKAKRGTHPQSGFIQVRKVFEGSA
jgi:hypothetical protein